MDNYIQFPRYSIYLIPNLLFIDQVNDLLLKNNIKFDSKLFHSNLFENYPINRLKNVVNNYQETVFIEEALHRLVEVYLESFY